jgi:hypothetical protein
MVKATTTVKQVLNYQAEHGAWFAANQDLYNQVCAFSYRVIQAHTEMLDDATPLAVLEKLTHTTTRNPTPVLPLSEICRKRSCPLPTSRDQRHIGISSLIPLPPQRIAEAERKNACRWQEVHRAAARSATFVEQVPHVICWQVERADSLQHCPQNLDRNLLELGQGPHYRT